VIKGSLWEDATAIDEVIPEAALPAFSLEVTIRFSVTLFSLHSTFMFCLESSSNYVLSSYHSLFTQLLVVVCCQKKKLLVVVLQLLFIPPGSFLLWKFGLNQSAFPR